MNTASGYTQNPDSYAAGLEIADALRDVQPELVIVFASINYDFSDFFNALYSVLPRDKTLVWGGTGDGIYSPGGVFHYGISAVGFNSGGMCSGQLLFAKIPVMIQKRAPVYVPVISAVRWTGGFRPAWCWRISGTTVCRFARG